MTDPVLSERAKREARRLAQFHIVCRGGDDADSLALDIALALDRFAEDARAEAADIVRAKYDEMARRSYPPPKLLLKLEAAIRARSEPAVAGGEAKPGASVPTDSRE